MNEEMKKPKYNNYSAREVFIDVAVRVQPKNEPSFEAKMKASLLKAYLLKQGVRVRVNYDPAKKSRSPWMMNLLKSWSEIPAEKINFAIIWRGF
jgi:hypothetical protein